MANPGLTKSYLAGAAIEPHRLVKIGADDDHVIQGAAVGDVLIGVVDQPRIAAAAEDNVDVIHGGIAEIEAGAAITRGDRLTTDAVGRAIAAAPAAGVNNGVIGIALVSAVLGDIFRGLITPGQIQG